MTGQRDPHILTDAALLIRHALLLLAGLFIMAGVTGAGFGTTWIGLTILAAGALSFAQTYRMLRDIRVKRVMGMPCAFENTLARLIVRVDNFSTDACLLAQLEDRFPAAGRERQVFGVVRPLLAAGEYEFPLEYECLGKRGKYTVGPMRLLAIDSLGLFAISQSDTQLFDFFVYPPTFPLPDFPFAGLAMPYTFGLHTSHRLGQGMEFVGCRDFRDWDETRHIHWAATARTGNLMLKEFEQTGAVRVSIFFDLSKVSLAGLGRHATTEYAIKIAASIAKQAIEEGHQVQVLAAGERLLYQPLGTGLGHLTEIMQELAKARGEGQIPLYNLIDSHVELVSPDSNAILIFSKCDIDVDRYVDAIRLLRSRRVQVIAVLIDHTSFLPVFELHRYDVARTAQARLQQQGVTVYLARQGDDLARALSLPVAIQEVER